VRRPPRGHKDGNHDEIARFLKQYGAVVVDLSMVGGGFPDLLAYYRGRLILVEVKAVKGTLRDKQREFARRWPVYMARTLEDVRAILTGKAVPITP
jgi:Holliday junction resolvase